MSDDGLLAAAYKAISNIIQCQIDLAKQDIEQVTTISELEYVKREVLAVLADTLEKPLQEKYEWLKKHTELDKKSGYAVSKERKELLQVFEDLLYTRNEKRVFGGKQP